MSTTLEPKTWSECAADALRELAGCTAYDGVTEVMVAIPNALWDRVLAMAAPTQREEARRELCGKCGGLLHGDPTRETVCLCVVPEIDPAYEQAVADHAVNFDVPAPEAQREQGSEER